MGLGRLDEKVIVVSHETVCVADPVHPLESCLEQLQEKFSVVIVEKYVLLMIPSVVDVIDRSWEFKSWLSWHMVLLC